MKASATKKHGFYVPVIEMPEESIIAIGRQRKDFLGFVLRQDAINHAQLDIDNYDYPDENYVLHYNWIF